MAQELYSIFNSEQPIQITSPVELTGNSPVAPLTITNNFNNGNSPALVSKGNVVNQGDTYLGGQTFQFTPPGNVYNTYGDTNFVVNNNGTYTFPGGTFNVTINETPAQPNTTQQLPVPATPPAAGGGGGGGGFVGNVVSGSGKNYQVRLFGTVDPGGTAVAVRFPMVSDSETIPIGTTIVGITRVQFGDSFTYYGSIPVWMA